MTSLASGVVKTTRDTGERPTHPPMTGNLDLRVFYVNVPQSSAPLIRLASCALSATRSFL